MTAQFRGLVGGLVQHGIAVIVAAMLLSWAAWILHRMRTMRIAGGDELPAILKSRCG